MRIEKEKINKILIIYILFQPFIDLFSSLGVRLYDVDISFGMIIRFIFLFSAIIYLVFFSKSKERKKSLIFIGIIFLYSLIYIINNVYLKGSIVLFGELKYILKLFYFPVLLIVFWNFWKEKSVTIKSKYLVYVAYTYVFIILLAQFTGTQFLSYGSGKLGHVGWFYAANEIGAIIAVLTPLVIYNVIKNNKRIIYYILLVSYIYGAFVIGTKVPLLAVLITLCMFFIVYIIKIIYSHGRLDKIIGYLGTIILPIIAAATISIMIFFISPVSYNLKYHLNWLELNRIEELYQPKNKTKLNNFIFSGRNIFLRETKEAIKNAKLKERMIGIGSIQKDGNIIKLIEQDYQDIYYKNGVVGFLIYFFFPFWFMSQIFIKVIKNLKKVIFNVEMMAYIISISLLLTIAYFAGHVFWAPAVSIYLVLINFKLTEKLEGI
ncbi:MAG: O-antigen ligase family protein [Bacilli bacterium]